MPNADEGTVTAGTDTAPPETKPNPMAGFSATLGWSDPEGDRSGDPEPAKAVETSAEAKAPEAKTDTPAAEAPKEPAKAADTPDPVKTVNFDGFSDKQRTTWEQLLKAGHVTPEDVVEAQKGLLRQSLFSQKTNTLARERETFEAEKARVKEDLELLALVRADPRRHEAFLSAARQEFADESSDDPVDKKTAEKIARETVQKAKAEDVRGEAEKQAAFDRRRGDIQTVVSESIKTLGVTPEVMDAYLSAEAGDLPPAPLGADPVKHFIAHVDPGVLRKNLTLQHEAATARAEAARLREQLSQRTSKQVQASKQSLPPARRETEPTPKGLGKVLADLGVGRLTDVPGFGWGPEGR